MNHKLALDFGTTNSVISRWDDDTETAEIIELPSVSVNGVEGSPPLVPSLLYVQDGQSGAVVIGQAVNERSLNQRQDNRLFRNFKRGIVASPAPKPRSIDGALWTVRDAGRRFIHHLLEVLPYPIAEIEQLILTAPVASFAGYLDWLSEAMDGLAAGDKIRIVDESTAAALGYAVTRPGAVVLVFDLGGGTLDLSLVQLPESREKTGGFLQRLLKGNSRQHAARVIAKAGQTIGGSDIDQWLLMDVLQRVGLSSQDLADDYVALLTVCEQAKIALSTAESVPLTFEAGGQSHILTITRPELEALLAENGFYTALRHVVDKVMHVSRQQGVFKEDVDSVLMVGGVSLMPSVQRLLKEYFSDMVVRADKPFTAVAEGALQVARGAGLDDCLVYGYGLRHLDPDTGQPHYDEIVPMGSRYPTGKPVEIILAAAHPDQTVVEFVLGRIALDAAGRLEIKYEDGQAVFVAQASENSEHAIPLNEAETALLAYLDPPGQPGEDRLKAEFTVDHQRRLRLTVTDLKRDKQILEAGLPIEEGPHSTGETPADLTITGREPCLSTHHGEQGQWRLSGRGLATMFNILPPESISLTAAAEALQHQDFFVRYNAATLLRRRGDRDARLIMQEVLAQGESRSRASVARQLYGFSWFALEPLLRQALLDPDLRVREAAIYALCDWRDAQAYQLMVEVLPDEDDFVRAAATFGLRECPDPAAVPVLEATMLAKDPGVRVKALDALSANATSEAVPVVRQALADPDPYVQYTAAMSLLELLAEQGLPELAEWIKQTRGPSREHIVRGFFQATNHLNLDVVCSPASDQVFAALETALQDDDPAARKAVMWPLAWLDHDRARSLLRQAYDQEQDDEVKAHIIHVAVNLLSPLGQELLEDGLRSHSERVCEMAEQIRADIEAGAIVVEWSV